MQVLAIELVEVSGLVAEQLDIYGVNCEADESSTLGCESGPLRGFLDLS
jgi:hypothetical protein